MALDLDRFSGDAGRPLIRGVVAHEFLDGVGPQARIGLQQRELLGMPEQCDNRLAHQVCGGDESRTEEHREEHLEFEVAQVTAQKRCGQFAFGAFPAQPGDMLLQVFVDLT
ncbi:Uncharacterised protein [Mycobacteroides abscessus subsp. massiliense]|nr:Uncharacterised protein [Mycobacteroides abscessus subsp. massiliense]